jgi:formamidopyrimidine-DNA glycosylase
MGSPTATGASASVPEGDTIHRAAATLDRVLAGQALVRFDAPTIAFRPFAPDTVVEGAEAQGKHCLIHFDDGRTLRTHMRMNGSWHIYRGGSGGGSRAARCARSSPCPSGRRCASAHRWSS